MSRPRSSPRKSASAKASTRASAKASRSAPLEVSSKTASSIVVSDDLETVDSSLLDLVDHVLNKGIVLTGDLMLGVADIDLVYLRLSAVLCAADRVLGRAPRSAAKAPEGSPSGRRTLTGSESIASRLGGPRLRTRRKRA